MVAASPRVAEHGVEISTSHLSHVLVLFLRPADAVVFASVLGVDKVKGVGDTAGHGSSENG